jgi:hypothetical protein
MAKRQDASGLRSTVGDYLAYVQRHRRQALDYANDQAAKRKPPASSKVRHIKVTPELEHAALAALERKR